MKQLHRKSGGRRGFTLLELLLSLALIVVATALIGSLMQLYARNFATRGEDIRRIQLARSILTMIAEDIRSVVVQQEYDPSVLEQLMGASGGSSGGGGGAAAGAAAGASAGSSLASSAASPGDDASASQDPSQDLAGTVSSYPPGIYGSQYQLMIDVSRVPRPDEYRLQQSSLLEGTLTDIPGDMKTVTYFVQSATNQGVDDDMSAFASMAQNAGFSSGLVRRQLDRGVTAYAEEIGNTTSLMRTGDLVAPEVIALEFEFFDGTQWLTDWDSSTQSLPWLVRISLAMQSATASEQAQFQAGTSLNTLSFDDRQLYGIAVYELVVAIPGAQLRAADATTADQDAGMESMGL